MGGVGEDGDEVVVLGGGADQRGSADVDVLDDGVGVGTAGDGRLEGVEGDGDEIDGRDPVRLHLGEVVAVVASAEDAAMDLRHEGFDPSVHDFGEAGVVGDIGDGQPGVAQRAGVPPVERISAPACARAWAKGISPVLSETEMRARRTAMVSDMGFGA